jgi:hypothetical protein
MNAERWQKIKGLFDAAQELEPKKCEKFLDNDILILFGKSEKIERAIKILQPDEMT